MSWKDVEIEVETIIDTDLGLYIKRIERCMELKDYDGALRECESFRRMGGRLEVYTQYCSWIKKLKEGASVPNSRAEQELIGIISEVLGIKTSQINGSMHLSDLGADSLDGFQIVMAIEEDYNIEISPATSERALKLTIREMALLLSDLVR